MAYFDGRPVAFCGVLHFPHDKVKNFKKITRIVTLPDYQGVGIGSRMLDTVAQHYHDGGYRVTIVTSTPALIASFKRSGKWKLKRAGRVVDSKSKFKGNTSKQRFTTSWEYKP